MNFTVFIFHEVIYDFTKRNLHETTTILLKTRYIETTFIQFITLQVFAIEGFVVKGTRPNNAVFQSATPSDNTRALLLSSLHKVAGTEDRILRVTAPSAGYFEPRERC